MQSIGKREIARFIAYTDENEPVTIIHWEKLTQSHRNNAQWNKGQESFSTIDGFSVSRIDDHTFEIIEKDVIVKKRI